MNVFSRVRVALCVVVVLSLAVLASMMLRVDRTSAGDIAPADGDGTSGEGRAVAREVPLSADPPQTTVAPTAVEGDTGVDGDGASDAEVASSIESNPFPAGTCTVVTYTPPTAAQAFEGDLCRPAEQRHETAVLLIHGGGGVGGVRSDFEQWRDAYLDAGYVTFSMSYRLVDPATDVGVFPQPESNTKAAIQYLRLQAESLDVAADRVVAHGASAGARLAGIAFATPDDPLFGTTERWEGVSDELNGFIGYYGYYDGWSFEPQAYFRAGVSPLANAIARAGGAAGSALLVHGQADWLVDASFSEDYAAALDRAGVDVTLAILPGENHSFDGYDQDALTPAGEIEFARVDRWLTERFG